MNDGDAALDAVIGRARGQALSDIPRRTARRFPDKLALVDGDTRLSFAEFDAIVDRVATALAEAGLERGERLAILAHNCWQYPVLVFAAARLGVVVVPINFMLGASEIAYILDHGRVAALVAEDALAATGEEAQRLSQAKIRVRAVIGAARTGWEEIRTWLKQVPKPLPDIVIEDDEVLRLMYTSGTESRPKGAMLSSRSLMWQYVSILADGGMDGHDIEVHALPLYHCAQLDCFLIPDIYLGSTSIILQRPDPGEILAAIERERATKLFAPPTVWIALLRSPHFATTDLSSLRKGYYGASAMPREVLLELQERLPQVRLWNFYGQTEMAPMATVLQPEDQLTHAGSAGRAALNAETLVVDDEDRPLDAGVIGEIVHRSPHAMSGYLNDPDRTAAAFRNSWFHSGDLGYLDDDGYLYVVDRKKDMIKTGGENVASREVEETLYEHEGIAETAVFGVPHPTWIEAVVAAVVPKDGVDLAPDAVIAFCRERLAGYKTPKYVVIVGELPKNPSGKLLKRELRERFSNLGA
ncbi:acyl-CoA synthetase [Nocardia sp. NEAU-G5]|uniref:Acyl-CoA synthetase n=1 Tax=Nocardia albiluteola TaxID=2842303 RepID=A0ABS6B3V9_9NOCA|nr:acyl-CoA synthetase [Nocardia albiluteola]MBU3064984.1 acyl-CoA synthetase [Nocardia albiluteola]